MKKIFTIIFLLICTCQIINAKQKNHTDTIAILEEQCSILQNKQAETDKELQKLSKKQEVNEHLLQLLDNENKKQGAIIDSLRNACNQLTETQSTDRKNIGDIINETNNNVQTNQDSIKSRTLLVGAVIVLLLVIIVGVAYRLAKNIKSGTSTIDDVRKAQETLQAAQTKMQEESVKLDNQLLDIVRKQLDAPKGKPNGEPDHSLVVKLADEIARIETNLSKMDKSVKGYKQLVQAKDRMINNVRAYGYEIISLLGQEYNDGMQFQTRFIPDESLPEGKRIITGMIKMQVNYNGKMIQPAEIVVSQNI